MKQDSNQVHWGDLFKNKVIEIDPKRKHLAKAMNMTPENLYKLYGKKKIPIDYMLSAGKYLDYDFSHDIPELPSWRALEKSTEKNEQKSCRQELEALRVKYIGLLEKHNLLLEQLHSKGIVLPNN